MNDKQKQLLDILAAVTERPVDTLKLEQELKGDLELDSAQTLELLSEIEDAFDTEISEVDAAKVKTVGDLLEFAP
jgi:acyl carrier protein